MEYCRLSLEGSCSLHTQHSRRGIRFATTLRVLRSSMGSPFSVGATCSVEHRHASDVRRSTPGALAPVQVMLSWTIIT